MIGYVNSILYQTLVILLVIIKDILGQMVSEFILLETEGSIEQTLKFLLNQLGRLREVLEKSKPTYIL